jgi:hypothetical protein
VCGDGGKVGEMDVNVRKAGIVESTFLQMLFQCRQRLRYVSVIARGEGGGREYLLRIMCRVGLSGADLGWGGGAHGRAMRTAVRVH